MHLTHWYDQAACRGLDVELFFSEEPAAVSAAMRVCGSCPVREACLDTAMTQRESYGIWGGVPENHRQRAFRREDRARRRQQRAA